MDPITSRLDPQFGSFPEPVIFLSGGHPVYSNEPGSLLLQGDTCPAELLAALAEHPGGAMEIALGQEIYRVTVSPMEGGDLLVLRPMPQPQEQKHPFSNAVFRMRECLSNFTAVQWRMKRVLDQRHLMGDFEQDMAHQSRLIYQMLRLTKQAELTQELNDKTFPREEGFDLAQVCQGMAEEASWLADLAGVRFSYASNVDHLPFQGSKSLLTQMLLALVSNSIRAAGKEGEAEMKLHAENGRCVISLRDSGVGIPEDRMATLFSGDAPEEIPRPGEGAGLGLYNAQRIAALHGGVLVAQSGQDGGACLVVSLPIVVPGSVPARNNPGYDNLGGYSPVLIELSDVLPWQAFVPSSKDD
ncbi:MAG: HAMP domain-containing sensor histidine kinase [Evtepia sp.]|uniref:sensor histidine kinase n=1 Tax=Evtepia sp. TaxID=2773933 RepID=UPI002A74940A|nr:HAMP domain-containing sensor histidine kinase [Evtepia sp.]MDY3014727.1 HAMP domain-containing sensor histidine kinase [Evtepia sp.]